LRVHIENVRAAHLSGAEYSNTGVTGPHWSGSTCPASTTTYTLHVTRMDGSTEDRTVTVNVTPAFPDLSVTAVEFRPSSPAAGATFAVDIQITNSGLANASNFNVRAVRQARGTDCPGPGTVLFDRRFSVDAGQTSTFSEDTHIDEAGDYSICIVLDHLNEIPESNEGNNSFQRDLTIAGLPDLYPFYIGMNTWHPRVGMDVTASITLRNGGNAPVSNFTVRLLRQSPGTACPGPGTVLFDESASLDANGSQVFFRTFQFTEAGTFQLCAILDHLDRVAESNEGNNTIVSDQNVVVSP